MDAASSYTNGKDQMILDDIGWRNVSPIFHGVGNMSVRFGSTYEYERCVFRWHVPRTNTSESGAPHKSHAAQHLASDACTPFDTFICAIAKRSDQCPEMTDGNRGETM